MRTASVDCCLVLLLVGCSSSESVDVRDDDSKQQTEIPMGGVGGASTHAGQPPIGGGGATPNLGGSAGSANGGGTVSSSGGTVSSGGQAPALPAEVLDLTNWYLTLPTGKPEDPDDVYQPELAAFQVDPYFRVATDGRGVAFMAPAGGVTTSGSSYPRSELREMTADGAQKASWSTSQGEHSMLLTEAITHLPVVKPDIVAAQIHDADSDEVMIRLTGTKLYVEYKPTGQKQTFELEPSYQLGSFFTAKIVASGGAISVYYQDLTTPAVTFQNPKDGCYFKAGAYTHSTPATGDEPDAFGEVVIRELVVTHQ